MEATIVSRLAFTVVGLHYRGKNEENEIAQMWATSGSRLGEIEHVAEPGVAFGVIDHMDAEAGAFEYVAGLAVERAGDVPEGMVSWEIPAQTYAVFTCTLPTIRETMHRIYEEWLPASGYERPEGPEFELYGPAFDPRDPGSEMEVWIPVRRL
ncbi:MAG: GyrI-like domain-containing protein [Anaerolineae bacterium]|nr:GyrI-like domain-containing protein [Anaerolineae bacterium]